MIDITFTVTGLAEAQARINQIIDRLNEPKEGLERATNQVAGVFAHNYDTEGGLVGGWAQLAEVTNAMREWQGYSAEHPILIRYGALRAVAVEFFQEARAGSAISVGDDYSGQTVSGSLQINRNVATLHIGGSYKVLNQFDYTNIRTGPNGRYQGWEARPYWFVSNEVVAAASKGVRDWVVTEVLKS